MKTIFLLLFAFCLALTAAGETKPKDIKQQRIDPFKPLHPAKSANPNKENIKQKKAEGSLEKKPQTQNSSLPQQWKLRGLIFHSGRKMALIQVLMVNI